MRLDSDLASRLARIALGHVTREYPHKLDHVLDQDADAQPPRLLHPIFFGSFDWHSCVHGWWTLLTLRRLFPHMPEASEITALADESFTLAKVSGELAYLERLSSGGFERPYGWAWLLYLHLEASRHDEEWAIQLEPLAQAFAGRLQTYLGKLTYPIRAGTHFNTAFALVLSLGWAEEFDPSLATTIQLWAVEHFRGDRDCQAWEPSGDDFLSPALIEATCMAQVMAPDAFSEWFAAFLPRLVARQPATLFTPASVSDRSDGKIAHLDGLNLSRAWCWRRLAARLPDRQSDIAEETATIHIEAALPHVAGDYAGEHWLASFALLAMISEPKR
jgi:hypothetical protein